MNEKDKQVVETIRREGIGILPNILTRRELDDVRKEFDQAYLDEGKGSGDPGTRDSITGEDLYRYLAIARLIVHPRILGVVTAILGDPKPWIFTVKTNRYTPEHPGVNRHSDGFRATLRGPMTLSPPFIHQSMAVFLDDISEESGALTYVPGSHLRSFEDPNDPEKCPPTQEEIDTGDYISAELTAGSVLFRVPEVWHAVNPIHHLRRYITAPNWKRGSFGPMVEKKRKEELERRKHVSLFDIPESIREYWIY